MRSLERFVPVPVPETVLGHFIFPFLGFEVLPTGSLSVIVRALLLLPAVDCCWSLLVFWCLRINIERMLMHIER